MAKEKVDEKEEIKIPEAEATEKIPEGYTAEEWLDLSPTEKEGILSGPGLDKDEIEGVDEIDDETLESIVGEEEKPSKEVKPSEEKKVEIEGKPPIEEKPVEEKASAEAKPPEEEISLEAPILDEELLRFRAVVSDSEMPPLDQVPTEIQQKLEELETKYETGDITLKDYNRDRDKLNRDVVYRNIQLRDGAKDLKIWEKEQAAFLNARPEYVKKTEDGELLWGMLGGAVKSLSSKYDHMELLVRADKLVKQKIGTNPKAPAKEEKPATGKEVKEVKPPAKLPDHKTLVDIPSAARPEVGENWATALDRLHGEAYEAALERLTPEQRDRYLNAPTGR